jgi:aerobic carbon-monoxide dehydrogenase small subunit
MKQTIRVTINGRLYEEDVEPRILLSHFLRENIGLTGTHIGCVVGECGACSVLLDDRIVKSCLQFAVQADGREVTTVEGLAKDGELSPIQEAFVKHYAFQCGYCTPGMVITSHALLQRNPGSKVISFIGSTSSLQAGGFLSGRAWDSSHRPMCLSDFGF